MKNIIGILIVFLGGIITVLGPICLTLYAIFDLISKFDSLSGMDIFWLIAIILGRDILSILVGLGLIIIGFTIKES